MVCVAVIGIENSYGWGLNLPITYCQLRYEIMLPFNRNERNANMNKINSSSIVRTISAAATAVGIFSAAHAGVPLNNLQGAGGIAFNPLAYTAGRPWDGADGGDSTNEVEHSSLNGIVSRPQFGAW